MGFNKSTNNDGSTFAQVIAGQFAIKVAAGTKDAVARVNKKGDTVHELIYGSLSGCIFQDLSFENTDFGEQIRLSVISDGEPVVISVPTESRYGNSLLWKLPFIDAEKKFKITPYDFETKEGKRMVGLSIAQGLDAEGKDIKIDSGYSIDEVPQVKVINARSGTKYDFTERQDWLAGKLEEWANSVDPMSVAEVPVAEKPIKEQILAKNAANKASIDDFDDDLPF